MPAVQVKDISNIAADKGVETLKQSAESLKVAASKGTEGAANVKTFFGHVKEGVLSDWRAVASKLKE